MTPPRGRNETMQAGAKAYFATASLTSRSSSKNSKGALPNGKSRLRDP